MVEFYAKIAFAELLREDGLLVIGRGLGIEYIYGKFLQLYSENDFRTPGRVVLCLNCMGHEVSIRESMLAHGAMPDEMPKLINSEVPSTERVEMYEDGGCFFITSRILIVDLLDATLDPMKIAGLLIYNAHKISETSLESFVIRIYREHNRTGFIKALTEDPESLQSGFGKVERLLRTLYLKKLYLYPRFRKEVVDSLESGTQPVLSESNLQLTVHMKAIQAAVLVAMNTCLQELKKACPHLDDHHGSNNLMTLENGLFSSFDSLLRTQLDSDWHKLSLRTKQLIHDMSTLRKLLDYLIRYDSFSFYYLLLKLRSSSSEQKFPSLWLMTEAGHQIFIHAQQRVYRTIPTSTSTSKSTKTVFAKEITDMSTSLQLSSSLEPILECPPKWCELLTIFSHLRKQKEEEEEEEGGGGGGGGSEKSRVLLIVRDELASSQLRDLLVHGSDFVMDNRFRWFVSQKSAEIRRQLLREKKSHNHSKKRTSNSTTDNNNQEGEFFNDKTVENLLLQTETVAGDESNTESRGFGAECASLPEEAKLLLLQEKILQMTQAPLPSSSSSESGGENSEKKRVASARMSSSASAEGERDTRKKGRNVIGSFVPTREGQEGKKFNYKTNTYQPSSSAEDHEEDDDGDDIATTRNHQLKGDFLFHSHPDDGFGGEGRTIVLTITTHATLQSRSSSSSFLPSLQPTAIILYDSDVTIIRQIEVYQALLNTQFLSGAKNEGKREEKQEKKEGNFEEITRENERKLQVFLLQYEGSTEEHRFVGHLSREKKAFDSLIEVKRTMVVSLPDHPLDLQTAKNDDLLSSKIDSRSDTFHTKKSSFASIGTPNKRKVVVDVREFRSILPSILYATQFWSLLPRTLNVGDFVLSSEICVERKGISDLFQSFASGRLYNQIENMLKYYKLPCLLIEFAQDKSFVLTPVGEISADIQVNAIQSKIVLLAQSFPQLKVLWSRSPQQTADIFRLLISGHGQAGSSYGEVDAVKAVSVGSAADSANKDNAPGHGQADDRGGAEEGGGGGGQDGDDNARLTAQEVLLSLPGINVHNYREVMHRVNNIAALSKMNETELAGIIGAGNAKKLRAFFTQRVL